MADWQPIETAPKDRTRVLVWHPMGFATTAEFREYKLGILDWRGDGGNEIPNPQWWRPLPEPPAAIQTIPAKQEEPARKALYCPEVRERLYKPASDKL